ncbi:MAG: radical SAM protein, partial [Theionarchaea archaeon]|nr:radical SAM protein [Theionarchaea archaeon]
IAVTCDCNLRCYYCCEIWAKNPHIMGEVMNKYKVDKAFEALETLNKDCKEMKPLTLTGGEPLMKKNKDIVTYILKKGDELGYQFAILTNGVDMNYFLSELSSVKVMYVQITLDGPRDIHDKRRIFRKGEKTFDTITNNIEKARKMGIPLRIRTNTDSEIFSRISELTEFFTENGWIDDPCIQFSLNHLYDKNADIDKTQEFISLYEKVLEQAQTGMKIPGIHNFLRSFRLLHPVCEGKSIFCWPTFWYCSAVSRKLVFDPFGDVYPCQSMLGWKEERIGVYIPELSFNDKYDKWRNRTIFKMEECRSCSLALICGGECPYNSLLREKDLYKPVCMATEKIMTDYLNTFMD